MVGSSKTAENSTGPSHVLFAVSPNANSNTNSNANRNTRTPITTEAAAAAAAAAIHISSHHKFKKRLLCDPRLDKDYVSKRQRAHEEFSGWKTITTTTTTTTTTPWEGVSGFEQELVKCCQDLPDDYYESDEEDNNNNNNDVVDDGIITDDKNAMMIMMLPSIGGVLAVEKEARFAALISRCHTMASKCLAMAILERTLEAYLEETAREQHDETTTTTTTTNDTTPDNVAAAASEYKSNRRFRLFFAAGGLRILNQWLAEASSTNNTKSFDGLSSKQQQKASTTTTTTTRTMTMTTTRPIALSILLFLQHIPFDKKTVTNSKINKQVQKLGKKVASIQEAHQNQLAPIEEEEEDLNLWTIQNNNNKKESLVQILAAIDAVKASWREKAKEKKLQNAISLSADPFGRLQSKIRERFKVWNDFEARNEKPDWYRSPYTKQKNSTEAERILQTKIKQMQSRSQKSLQQLRAKLRKQQQQQQQQHSSVNNHNKTVKWKDASSNREEKLLEDVIVFEKDLPPCSVGTDLSA